MEKGQTHNQIILAEAREHRNRLAMDFGREIDTYRRRLRKGDKLSEMKLETWYLSYLIIKGLFDECYEKANQLNEFFVKAGDKEFTGITLYYIARCKMFKGQAAECMTELMQSIEMLSEEGAEDMLVSAEHALSDVLFTMGFNDQALAILYKHKQIATQMASQIGIVILGSKISNVLCDNNRTDESLSMLNELEPIIDSGVVPMPFPIAYRREWMEYFLKTNKPKKALEVYQKYFTQNLSEYPQVEAQSLYFHARCMHALNENARAAQSCREHIAMCRKMGYGIMIINGYKLLIDILISQKQYDEAETALKQMKALPPKKSGIRYQLMYENCCAKFYEETNDTKTAMQHYKKCIDLEHAIQKSEGEIKLKALYQLSQEEFNNRELNELKNQLQMKRDELEVSAIYIKQHETMLSELDSFMKELREDNKRKKNAFKEVHAKIKALQLYESDKQSIEDKINSDQQQYIILIKTKCPALSNTEARVCSLLRSGLSSKEIAALLIIDVHTVEQHRYRIRKKLGVTKTDDLMMILNQV